MTTQPAGNFHTAEELAHQLLLATDGTQTIKKKMAHFATTNVKKVTEVMDQSAGRNAHQVSVMMELTAENQIPMVVVLDG